jgi:hypothetical protein
MSEQIIEDGISLKVEICRLEDDAQWSLEVVTDDGTSSVWDDLFDDDAAAFNEAVETIRTEDAQAFRDGGSNVIPFKRHD